MSLSLLYPYNQLMGYERKQVPTQPADQTEPRYFLVGYAIYDVYDFRPTSDGMWSTDGDGVVHIQRIGQFSIMRRLHDGRS